MRRMVHVLAGLLVLCVLAILYSRFLGYVNEKDKIREASRSCATVDQPPGGYVPPSGFTLPTGQKLLNVTVSAGRGLSRNTTTAVSASLPGNRSDVFAIRDRVAQELVNRGYVITGTSQEPNFGATARVSKDGVKDSFVVTPLCLGRVVIRYSLHAR